MSIIYQKKPGGVKEKEFLKIENESKQKNFQKFIEG